MQSPTLRAARRGRLALPVVFFSALAACSDQQPLSPRNALDIGDGLQAFECRATVGAASSIRCAPLAPDAGGALATVIGGQNQYVTLTSSNTVYEDAADLYQFDVTVQNLMNEAMGTPDGVTPHPDGIRVFFLEDPVGVGGDVMVLNLDGIDFFTAANQGYFRYSEILDKDEVSGSKTWQFGVPDGVTSFSFRVLISTQVDYQLVINEILVNPGGTITDLNGEWIELYNAGSLPVDLQNLVIADSAAAGRRAYHLISSSVVVQPGGYVTLGKTTNTTNNGGVPIDYVHTMAGFPNSLGAFKISRVAGTDTLTLDRTQFASAAVSAQNGVSRELKNPALDNTDMDGSNWGDASVTSVYGPGGRGTPKAQNSTFTP